MLRKSPWREALAKAIAILLESGWMDSKLGIDEKDLEKSLLPHQIDGLKRALWILENKGSVKSQMQQVLEKPNLEHGCVRLHG